MGKCPLTRIANRIAKGNSGQSDLSPRGEEIAGVDASLFSPTGRRWPPTGLASGKPEDRLRGRMRGTSYTRALPQNGARLCMMRCLK
ncbi:hypothetical protein X772_00050 [Mesorhizobium sp. LSJC280B00]|nr:hypothetical protein X772_00050 [Mesorhizobium sp. LSJC280B00]